MVTSITIPQQSTPAHRPAQMNYSTVFCGSIGQPEVPKSAISLSQRAPNMGLDTEEQLSQFDCNFHDADQACSTAHTTNKRESIAITAHRSPFLALFQKLYLPPGHLTEGD